MPFPFWPFKPWPRPTTQPKAPTPSPKGATTPSPSSTPRVHTSVKPLNPEKETAVRRHFYNEKGFQCYASFFPHWGGWITAGHCLSEAGNLKPPFTKGPAISWPAGLDAGLIGCTLPKKRPKDPVMGQRVLVRGYPAGSRHVETRMGHIYIERGTGSGTWIVHIETPDEPVVTGMSGGPVKDYSSGEPVGIIITRNSPADLNNDRDPDESCDFVALSSVWDAVMAEKNRPVS